MHNAIGFVPLSASSNVRSICMNLAHLLIACGYRVTVIDGNVNKDARTWSGPDADRCSTLADLAIDRGDGIALDFLDRDGVSVLPARSRDQRANFLFDSCSPRIAKVIEAVRERGEVLIELPPIGVSDSRLLAGYADTLVIVVEALRDSLDDLQDAVDKLGAAGIAIAGIVITSSGPR
jgi:hypothetical protein